MQRAKAMRQGGSPAAIPDEVTQDAPGAQACWKSGPFPAQEFQLRTFMHKLTQPPEGCAYLSSSVILLERFYGSQYKEAMKILKKTARNGTKCVFPYGNFIHFTLTDSI
jgi:hypothetical protein